MNIDPSLATAATLVLAAFTALAGLDGIYIHLVRLRLHTHAETRREHLLHTARAVLFPALALLLFAWPSGGPLLWAGVAVAAADTVAELWDVFVEPDSRKTLGGLSRGEYLLHVVLTILRSSALVLTLTARPAEAWSLDAPSFLSGLPSFASTLAANLVPGGVLGAVVHLWLAARGTRQAEMTS